MLFGATGVRYLVILVISVHEILQDGTAFPNLELLAVLVLVDDGWDATVGVDVEEPRLFLLMLREIDCAYLQTGC